MKDFGSCLDRSGVHMIYEVPSEADLFAYIHKWMPYADFDARQFLTFEQVAESVKQAIESRKEAALQARKQIS